MKTGATRFLWAAAPVAVGAILAGCKSAEPAPPTPAAPMTGSVTGVPGEPEWVSRGGGLFQGDQGKKIYAVGVTARNPNPNLMLQMARDRGRQEIARIIQTTVQSMATDYQKTAGDYLDPDTRSSTEFYESIARSVTNQTLSGAQQVASWRNPQSGDLYILMEMDWAFFENAYQKQMEMNVKRRLFAKNMQEQANGALEKLDEQIEKMDAMDAAKFNAMYGNP